MPQSIAILAEGDSDAKTLAVIVRRRINQPSIGVKAVHFDSGGNLLHKGAKRIALLQGLGVSRFVVCHDADRNPPHSVRAQVIERVVNRASLDSNWCVVVPVQEIEAWMIADEWAVGQAIPSFRLGSQQSPEAIVDPKEWLIDRSRTSGARPLYVPPVHNEKVAQHLRFDVVSRKCPSFKAFLECLGSFGLS